MVTSLLMLGQPGEPCFQPLVADRHPVDIVPLPRSCLMATVYLAARTRKQHLPNILSRKVLS